MDDRQCNVLMWPVFIIWESRDLLVLSRIEVRNENKLNWKATKHCNMLLSSIHKPSNERYENHLAGLTLSQKSKILTTHSNRWNGLNIAYKTAQYTYK